MALATRVRELHNWLLVGTRQRTPYLIGREQPLRVLFDALDTVTEAAGSVVLVSGEAGIGKTRLLDEFASRADDARVARGGCVEGVAYAPWTDAIWWLLGTADLVDVDALPNGVRDQLARLIPHLGAAPAGEDGGQHVLFEAIVELLAYVAAHTNLVLVVDDLQWIDPASRELLRYVAGNLRRAPILLVAAYRPEDSASERELIAQLARHSNYRVALDGLPDEAVAEMATLLIGDDDGAADVERIARDAEGNPLFVEELVAARDESRMPQTLRDLMSVRFNSLDNDARHLVRTAALIGPRAPCAWLVGATGLDSNRARDAARAAVDTGVLLGDDDGRGYTFRHALLRQAVLDDLVPDERVALERAIADALDTHPERGEGIDRVAELAWHWDAAETASPALHWNVAAGQHAEASYAFEAATHAYARALFWWDAVAEPTAIVGIDHVALLLATADTAGFAGQIERAADLGRAALEEACALEPGRGVEAAGRVYPLMWTADRAPELHEFATRTLLPVLDRVDPLPRARFLVGTVEHLLTHASAEERRQPALQMLEAIRDIGDPALEARAHMVMAHSCELAGDFARVDAEYEEAVAIAREGRAHSMVALVRYNQAAFYSSVPDFTSCVKCLDDVDELVEQYGLRRYLLPARCLRALATVLQGDVEGAAAVIASVDDLFAEGYDAWFRASVRSLIHLIAGEHDAAIAAIDPDVVGIPAPRDFEHVIELSMLRADALAWQGDLVAARRVVDEGATAVNRYPETYWHGWLAMVAMRIEADAAVAASSSRRLDHAELTQERADAILATWTAAVAQLEAVHPLVHAYSVAIAAERARVAGEDFVERAHTAADAFDAISMPYYATYFRMREGEAMLVGSQKPAGTVVLRHARGLARAHDFTGLDNAITVLARTHQLRLGPGRTTIDGDEPLSTRERQVLGLLVDGKTNLEIAELLFISRHTATAHVSGLLRKLGAASRVEAVSEAHRRGLT